MKHLEDLVNKVRQLPPARQQQVFNFVEFLAQRHENSQESEPDDSEIDTSDIPELDDAFFERAEFRRLQRRRGEKGKVDKDLSVERVEDDINDDSSLND
ncbi:Protein of unknown function [Marinobacter persicus]|uniref:Uncharacterized protein n=1 Tax=Marinobacter persicus TaxID=930118 RepID=A0A1I3PCF7_9GAMM|nr:DUF2281 domain-containing protein [Marinobacter persicus]GHD47012.1 hypothetical protein GCM10008110_14390 [Marinobacter persicus]SFJ18726.1 Protein of unknown function [Marinobacter persicus]